MTTPITEVDTFTAQLLTILDGDAANAATMLAILQPLANRTKNLKTLVDAAIAAARGRTWTWANAAARVAQSGLVAGDVGKIGYQTDMDLEYVLLAVTPAVRWGRLEDPSMTKVGEVLVNAAGNTYASANILNIQTGSFGARTLAGTNKATARPRSGLVTGAVAGNTAYARGTGGQQVLMYNQGWRYRIGCGPGVVSASMRWAFGLFDVLGSNVNQSPTVILNAVAVGADASVSGNLQIYTNDSSGAATATDVGAGFPGATAGNHHEVDFYSPDGTDVRYQVLNQATGAEVSGTISSNVPAASPGSFNHGLFVTNNADAVAVAVDISSITFHQRGR